MSGHSGLLANQLPTPERCVVAIRKSCKRCCSNIFSRIGYQMCDLLAFGGRDAMIPDMPSRKQTSQPRLISTFTRGETIGEDRYAFALRHHHAPDDAKALLASWEATHG